MGDADLADWDKFYTERDRRESEAKQVREDQSRFKMTGRESDPVVVRLDALNRLVVEQQVSKKIARPGPR